MPGPVPNRAEHPNRKVGPDYSSMSNEQLKGIHAQAVANPQIPKYAARVREVSAEMKSRGL